ncbi:hypothetical protein LTR37_019923 [Vermiconidia calcicola]|uniref:Uncharacterized protein n=1 Tax=Vermiconidia calcicola TaxID=1690605 RepID=A0ACC3MCR2_9PEZI|nr:hypothetical protein LTR37_019923 [Vermiconidia calcicola]
MNSGKSTYSSASGASSDAVYAKHESQIAEPQLRSLHQPIAIHPEYIAHKPTKIIISQHEYTSLGRDYTIRDANDEILYVVKADSLSWSQRRSFEDASGHPLFTLRRRIMSKKRHWYLDKPGEDLSGLMKANIHWSFTLGLTFTVQNAAAGGAETQIELMEIGPHGRKASISANGVDLAIINRTAPDGSNGDNLSERASFKRRPFWTIHIAEGMDVSLVAVMGVICAEHFPEYHFSIS